MRFLLLSLPVLLFSGCHAVQTSFSRSETKDLETTPLTEVRVSTFNGGISVTPSTDEMVHMTVTYKAYGHTQEEAQFNCEKLNCEIGADNGVLTLQVPKPAGQWSPSAVFALQIPPSCKLDLKTSNGKVDVLGSEGNVAINTSNGTVELKNIAGDTKVKTSNGRIIAKNVFGAIDLHSSNGKINFAGQLIGDQNRITTSNGSVNVSLPPEHLVHVTAKTSNGSISCQLPTQRVLKEKKRSFEAVVGEGNVDAATDRLSIETSNGSVKFLAVEPEEMMEPTLPKMEIEAEGEITTDAEAEAEITL